MEKYTDASVLQSKIDAYFDSISRLVVRCDNDGQVICTRGGDESLALEWLEPPTLSGLCLYLGIDKECFRKYGQDREFADVVKRAMQRLENYLERELFRQKQIQGIMFSLKSNYGWEDDESPGGEEEVISSYSAEDRLQMLFRLASEFLEYAEKSGIAADAAKSEDEALPKKRKRAAVTCTDSEKAGTGRK